MVTIIGTGNMARGIGTRLLAGGESVTFLGTSKEKADALANELRGSIEGGAAVKAGKSGDPIDGDIVILAVPYSAAGEIIKEYEGQFAGKVVVDISNPLNATYDDLATPAGSSAAEELARLAPQAKMVKAFNTTFARTLLAGHVAGQSLDVFIAGDDPQARASISELARKGGLNPVEMGPIRMARQLEQMGFLGINLQQPLGLGFESGWKLLKPQP